MSTLWASSAFGAKSRKPLVELRYQDTIVQISPTEAREYAASILQAAEAAEQDAFLVDFGMKTMNLPWEKAAVLLIEYRKWREQHG